MSAEMAWHSIVTKVKVWDSSLKLFTLCTWIPVFTFFIFYFFNGNWDWADTPYVQHAHSTWFLECSRLVMSFFFLVDFG